MNYIDGDMSYAKKLFEETGQVVYTVGKEGNPAFTCQARPQEGEIFGEFPVRRDLAKYTRYPVIVPSPTPAYNTHYVPSYLAGRANQDAPPGVASGSALLSKVENPVVRGFCVEVMEYLVDAAGPNRGNGKDTGGPDRTILYGLQRPPLNKQDTVLRCAASTSFDELAPTLVPFLVTNAFPDMRVSVDPANTTVAAHLEELGVRTEVQSDADFESTCTSEELYNVVRPEALADNNNTSSLEEFPLVGQFVSLYFPLGHIKSTSHDDETFVDFFKTSAKWLQVRDA